MNNRANTIIALWVVLSIILSQGLVWAGWDEGMAAYKRGDYATALREFEPLAAQGDAAAQNNLALMYSHGQGVPQDYTKAVDWFRKAAEQGHAEAQFNLGVLYLVGLGVPRDDAKAVPEWRMADEVVPVLAINLDDAEVVERIRRSAEQGTVRGQNLLGFMYANGRGVPQDYVQAYAWYTLVADQGAFHAQKKRDEIASRMTLSQLEQAQALSREYFEQYVVPFRSDE